MSSPNFTSVQGEIDHEKWVVGGTAPISSHNVHLHFDATRENAAADHCRRATLILHLE